MTAAQLALTPSAAPIRIVSVSSDAFDVATRQPVRARSRRRQHGALAMVAILVVGLALASFVLAIGVATVGAISALADPAGNVDIATVVGSLAAGS